MKKPSVQCSVFLLIFLSILLLVGCSEFREVTRGNEPENIVFQTSNTWGAITQLIFLMLLGLASLVAGIFLFWVAWDEFKERKKLRGLETLLGGLLGVSVGVLCVLSSAIWMPYSERVTITNNSLTIEVEKKYVLKEEIFQINVSDIDYVKYVRYTTPYWSSSRHISRGKVILIISTESEIELTGGSSSPRYKLAQRISEVTHKELVETKE